MSTIIDYTCMTEDELFEQIVERGELDMVLDKEGYDSIVESVINDNIDIGGLDLDQNTEGQETHLKSRFAEYVARVPQE